MYPSLLKALLAYITHLDTASAELPDDAPYCNWVPVFSGDELQGFLCDDIGDSYSYFQVTEAEREWWKNKPAR